MEKLMSTLVPIIDLGRFVQGTEEERAATIASVQAALVDVGFFMLTNHGVAGDLIASLEKAALEFFDLPIEEKNRYSPGGKRANRGYGAVGSRTIGKTEDKTLLPSLQEGFGISAVDVPEDDPFYKTDIAKDIFVKNNWPSQPASFEPLATAYYREMSRLFKEIMGLLAVALKLPQNYFDPMLSKHGSVLRLVHYPELDQEPLPGEVRAGAHTDTGTLTILHIDDTPAALQVLTRSGEWIDINKIPGAYVINIGDLMMRWTNDIWTSNLHRVANPPFVNGRTSRRLSIVYFCQTNYDTLVECLPTCTSAENPPKYPPVIASQYSSQRAAERFGIIPVA